MNSKACPHCDGTQIVRDVQVSDLEGTAQFTHDGVGLVWKSDRFLAMRSINIEPMLADICTSCGTVVRIHVRHPNRKWQTLADAS